MENFCFLISLFTIYMLYTSINFAHVKQLQAGHALTLDQHFYKNIQYYILVMFHLTLQP